jgi:hypothetical protein
MWSPHSVLTNPECQKNKGGPIKPPFLKPPDFLIIGKNYGL